MLPDECRTHRSAGGEATTNKGKTWKSHKQLRSAWPVVYALLGVASWLVWSQGGFVAQKGALGRYACLLLANTLCWPPIFFGGHSRRFAFLDCGGETTRCQTHELLSRTPGIMYSFC